MRITAKLKNTKPLLYFRDKLLVSQENNVVLMDLNLTNPQKIVGLPQTTKLWLASNSRYLSRIFRANMGPAIQLGSSSEIIIWYSDCAYKVNLETGDYNKEDIEPQGGAPLSLHYHDGKDGIPEGIYFGEYFSNPNKNPAFIWHRNKNGNWSAVHEFATGTINHIHSVIVDPHDPQFIVLTGDYDHAARIWSIDKNMRRASPLCEPSQDNRACWILPEKEQFFFATDTHLSANSIRYLKRKNVGPMAKSEKVCGTPGSSIYALVVSEEKVYFSTAVEPGEPTGSNLKDIFTRETGPGIEGTFSCIYVGNSRVGFKLLYKERVDNLPLRLFGFGAFSFPAGQIPTPEKIHCYAASIKGLDGYTILMEHI